MVFATKIFGLLLLLSVSSLVHAQPTVRVPVCLQYPDSNTRVPCTGVVPVDKTTGNALDWSAVVKGSESNPTYMRETMRRAHWTETSTPLAANQSFSGNPRDDESTIEGGTTRWNNFTCFVWADQAGTLSVQVSTDGINWMSIQTQSWSANGSLYLIQPIFTKYSRCRVTNGATSATAMVVYSAFGF